MRKKMRHEATEYSKQHRRRRIWKRIVGVMACIVVFCTTYALILPAITQEKSTVCGLEEHTHSESCYTQITSVQQKTLACTYESLGIHAHTEDCYDESGALICGQADYVAHTHDASCVDETGALACRIPEAAAHVHTDECYETTADESGAEQSVLVCTEPEAQAHIHTDACFATVEIPVDSQSLTCDLEESGEHTHTDRCYGSWKLTCGMEEHTHTAECEAVTDLADEELGQVTAVIEKIDALESADQVEETLASYEDAEDWEGYAAYYEDAAQKTQAARDLYDALSDAQKQRITNVAKLNELAWLVPTSTLAEGNQGTIWENLDGDWAYVTYFMMKDGGLSTGTGPFDADDNAGNDSTAGNSILRTFDTATYTIQFNTTLRDAVAQQDVGGIKQGRLYFEFILPLSAEEVQFETSSMGWLSNSPNIKYEVVTASVNIKTMVNGVETEVPTECQVLRGSFTLTPTGSNDSAIGASTNELNVIIRALRMQNGETIQPIFTLWLQHNDVGATYNSSDDRLPASIVTGTNVVCGMEETKKDGVVEKHDTCEAATLYGTEITISARPMFNIGLSGINSNNTVLGIFNFDVADEMKGAKVPKVEAQDMINYGLGSIDGRMNGYGIRIELRGKVGQGMRGCEFPDEASDITINLEVTSLFEPSNSKKAAVPDYQALFWSGDANATRGSGGFNNDGRTIYTKKDYAHTTLPFNAKAQDPTSGTHMRCFNGGTWTFKVLEDGKVGDSKIQVTVSGFQFNVSDISNFPYTYTSGTKTSYNYYNPSSIQNYWEIEWAVFSAGELWLVQPFYGLAGTESAGEYIAEKYGEGQSYTKVAITDLYIRSAGGQELDEPADQTEITINGNRKVGTTDDVIDMGQYLKSPGGIDGRVIYSTYRSNSLTEPLTEGCRETDADWATVGSGVSLTTWLFQSKSEGEYIGVAYDNLVKFDDEFFLPDSSDNIHVSGIKTKNDQKYTVLWAAKPDGTGWTNDEEMKQATPDDLVFYATLDELNEAGKICIGTMIEIRGVGEDSAENQLALHIHGTIRSDCKPGQVYMVTRSSYAWSKKTTADQALAYHNTKYPENPYDSWEQLTLAEWNEYLQDNKDGFPSHLNTDRGKLLTEDHLKIDPNGQWPTPFWRQDYYSCNKGNTTTGIKTDGTVELNTEEPLKNVRKASYENGVYTSGYGALYYADSCLVISYDTTVDKHTAQTEADQTVKVYYDMGQNQRTVDYVVVPKLDRSAGESSSSAVNAMSTVIYVEDTLPATLSYILDSSYFGGDYTQDPSHQNQGTCTGTMFETTSQAGTSTPNADHPYLITVTGNDDGTTTIRWMIYVELGEGVTLWTDEIYFSAHISDAAAHTTENIEIDNTVKIWADGENARPFSLANGNMDIYSIVIEKTTAVSLSKLSDQLVMDWWEDFGFTMSIGNNSGTVKNGTVIVETLPFNGLYRSNFNGKLVLTEFSSAVLDANGVLLDDETFNFTFYYTTSEAYAGMLSSDLSKLATDAGYDTVKDWINAQNTDDTTVWHQVEFTEGTGQVAGMDLFSVVNLPQWTKETNDQYQQVTSIVAVGDLPAGATMKLHATVRLPNGKAGDYMVNYLSQDNLSSYARAQAVNRSIEGLTWHDKDEDGIQDAGEETVPVWAVLYKLNETTGKYDQYKFDNGSDNPEVVYVLTGYQISVKANSRADAVPYDEGHYKFTDLPAGTYKVLFKSKTNAGGSSEFDMANYVVSPQDVGSDDTVDSDAIGVYSGDAPKILANAYIEGIVMKEAKYLVYGTDESKYHDCGFYYRTYELPNTGGPGTTMYTVVGLVLILLSTANLLYRSKKRGREVT